MCHSFVGNIGTVDTVHTVGSVVSTLSKQPYTSAKNKKEDITPRANVIDTSSSLVSHAGQFSVYGNSGYVKRKWVRVVRF